MNLHKRLHFLSMPGLTSSAAISHRDVVYSYLGLFSQGKNDFDWMEESRGDEFRRRNYIGTTLCPHGWENDAKENLKLCDDYGADFIIKRNPRRESPEAWLAHAEQHGAASNPAKERPFIPAVFRFPVSWMGVRSIKSTVS
ncbi:hypothetical protein [Salibacterium halotolerans]|uniref:hypothetical protein n=1 Tax=Salibacterium halotolerans TaxID=1884432 RepID=UPI000B87873C|nr:hypothetical protein [Salibacterium halotolerans]